MIRRGDVERLTWVALQLLGAALVLAVIEWLFGQRPIAAVIIGAFLLDLWRARVAARFTASPEAATPRGLFRTSLQSIAWGLGLALTPVLAAMIGNAALVLPGNFAVVGMALGAVRTAASAFRDELLYRGIPLALLRHHLPSSWALAFSVALGIAPLVMAPGVAVGSLVLALSSGVFWALVWQRGEGGVAAFATHAAWLFGAEIATHGALLDVQWKSGTLSPVDRAAGFPAYLAALTFLLVAFVLFGQPGLSKRRS